jgi:hypothetical protein
MISGLEAGIDAGIGAVASLTAAETKRAALSKAAHAGILGARRSESMPQDEPLARGCKDCGIPGAVKNSIAVRN